MEENKFLVIYGPTAVGKTSLGIKLAREFSGEIISADSRQIYREMDIGTGKDLPPGAVFHQEFVYKKGVAGWYSFSGVKVWLLDVVSPGERFSAFEWAVLAEKVTRKILQEKKRVFLLGGSAFYLKAFLEGIDYQQKPDWKLREKLSRLSLRELQDKLKKIWPERWQQLNHADRHNPRRLIRALEIAQGGIRKREKKERNFLGIRLVASLSFLRKQIKKRVEERLKKGLLKEIEALLKKYSWESPGLNSLAYKEFKPFFQGEATLEEACQRWFLDEVHYAKRQLLWFRNHPCFVSVSREDDDWELVIHKKVKKWYYEKNGR